MLQMWGNTDQNNSDYEHFSRSVNHGGMRGKENIKTFGNLEI